MPDGTLFGSALYVNQESSPSSSGSSAAGHGDPAATINPALYLGLMDAKER
ncbi:MAG: hypothetical protein ACLSA6_05225 [Holdemania massiliensis]